MFRIISSKRKRELELTNDSLSDALAKSRVTIAEANAALASSSSEIRSLQYELGLYKEKVIKLEGQHNSDRQIVNSRLLSLCEDVPAPRRILHSKKTLHADLCKALNIIEQIKSYVQGL